MKVPRMNPLIAGMFGAASGGSTWIILRVAFQGTQKGSILAGVIFGLLIMGCCLLDDSCDCPNCER